MSDLEGRHQSIKVDTAHDGQGILEGDYQQLLEYVDRHILPLLKDYRLTLAAIREPSAEMSDG